MSASPTEGPGALGGESSKQQHGEVLSSLGKRSNGTPMTKRQLLSSPGRNRPWTSWLPRKDHSSSQLSVLPCMGCGASLVGGRKLAPCRNNYSRGACMRAERKDVVHSE